MDLKLDGKIALITGSSKGIGEAVARVLAREGAIVIVHGRDKTKTEEVAHDIIAQGGHAYAVTGDLTNEDEVQRLVDEAQAFVKPVEIVINNAGGSGGDGGLGLDAPRDLGDRLRPECSCGREGHHPPLAKHAGSEMGKDRQHFQPCGVDASIQEAGLCGSQGSNDRNDRLPREGRCEGWHHGKHRFAWNDP